MKHIHPTRSLALAFCISGFLCYGQQNRSTICHLGDQIHDSLPSTIHALQVDLKKDAKEFTKENNAYNSLNTLVLRGDATTQEWQAVFKKIKLTPSIHSVVFESGTFESLPYGYEGLYTVSDLSFSNNDELDQKQLLKQLEALPNLRSLKLEITSVFDLPEDLTGLRNLSSLSLTIADEETSSPVTFDYIIDKADKNKLQIRYSAAAGTVSNEEYRELTRRFSTSRDLDPVTVRFTPKYVNVKPPIKGIDVEREVYAIDPTIENVLTYPSGTIIRIPAGTFTYKNGNPVNSTVQVNYREFRDPVDFLVSGIPMKYDTGGVTTNFESAGMFELTANIGSEPLQMAKDKNIDMNFQTTSKDSTYNFYSFNDQTGNWEYLQKPKTVTSKTAISIPAPTNAYTRYINFIRYGVRIKDTTAFADRFTDKNYVYTRLYNAVGSQTIGYNSRNGWRNRPVSNLIKIDKVVKCKDGSILFHINSLHDTHPEMSEFKDVYFQLADAMNINEFKQKYFRKKYFSDIRIVASGDNIEVLLKDSTGIKTLNATLAKPGKKGQVIEVANASTRIKKYNRTLRGRERNFTREMKKSDRYYANEVEIREPKFVENYAYNFVKKMMNESEKKMTKQEFIAYCKAEEKQEALWQKQQNKEKIASLEGAQATSANLMQSLSLEGLGIYNCDQIQRMQTPVEIFASYKTKDQPVSAKAAYVIDKKNNSVFQYDGFLGYSAKKIAFDKNSKASCTLLAIGEDESISIYKPADFVRDQDQLTNRRHFDFPVTKIDANFTSVGQLKTLIGF